MAHRARHPHAGSWLPSLVKLKRDTFRHSAVMRCRWTRQRAEQRLKPDAQRQGFGFVRANCALTNPKAASGNLDVSRRRQKTARRPKNSNSHYALA